MNRFLTCKTGRASSPVSAEAEVAAVRVVVVGGGAAGMSAASRVKRLRPDSEVVVVERTRWVSFALCGIPYYIGCTVKHLDDLTAYPLEEFTKRRGIDVRIRQEVVDVDSSAKRVTVRDLESGREYELDYDYLVLATGARSRAPEIWPELRELENAFYVTHLDGANVIRDYLARLRSGSKIAIVGSGYVGIEMVEAVVELGHKPILIEAAPILMPRVLDEELSKVLEAYLSARGVEIIRGAPVRGLKASNGKLKAIELDSGELEVDAAIFGVGIRPNVELAVKAGARLGETGAIWVDDRMRTSIEGVYAAGDSVETTHIVTGKRTWFPFAQAANKMGYVAGVNIAGGDMRFPGVAGTSALKVFELVIAKTGLSLAEAKREGFNAVEASIVAGTKAHYMPGRKKIHLKVVADADTGRLLGATSMGESETAFWRVNVVASLIEKGATVEDLFFADLGYAPPLAPVWDPLVVAARQLLPKVKISKA